MKEDKEIIATQNKAQTKEIEIKSPRDSTNEVKQPSDATNEKKFKCSSCKFASFDTNQEFRTHFKTDWHNFNLKRKIEVIF